MSKKKFREIIVNDIKYGWTIKKHVYGKTLLIWLNKKIILNRDFLHSNKGEHIKITPLVVKTIIEDIINKSKEN